MITLETPIEGFCDCEPQPTIGNFFQHRDTHHTGVTNDVLHNSILVCKRCENVVHKCEQMFHCLPGCSCSVLRCENRRRRKIDHRVITFGEAITTIIFDLNHATAVKAPLYEWVRLD